MSEAELPVITRPPGDDSAVQSKRKSYVLKYCFFNHKLGMTFKIVNGRIVLDGVDKQLAERSGPSRRVSSRKSGRLSIVSVVDTKGDDEREEGDGKETEAGESALHDGNDDAADNDSEAPSTPIISMKKMSSKEESPTKQRPSTPSTTETSAPLAMSSSSQANSNGTTSAAALAPVVSTLEYSGIAYGSNDYSVASATPTSSSHKILVESEFLFGHNVKKMVKISGASINVERIISSVLESCQLTQSPDQLLFTFHDPEVDEFVVLDEFSLADFLQLPKKIIHLQSVAPLIPGASPEKKESKAPSRLASKSDEQEATSASTAQTVSTTPINKADKPLVARAHIVQLITFLGVHSNLSYRETRDMLLSAGTYGFVNFLVRLSLSQSRARDAASDSTSCNVNASRWKITADFPPLGSRVLSLNGVFINDLERSQQITLLKQRRRPFVIEFEVFDPPITDSHRPNPPTIKFSLFYSKYTSSYASKLRKQIDKILEDYETCDWADAKRQGTGSPQATIVSLYKYIEQELQRLDLFNPKRSRGEGFPSDMKDTHWHAVRTHIEGMIFKRIVTPTKQLFTLYQEPMDAIDPTDEEYQGNLFLINKRLDPPPSGHEPVLPRALPRPIHSADKSPTDPLTAAAASSSSSSPQNDSTVPIDAHMHLELSAEHGLNMKLAYLRFVTLEILGIHPAGSEHHDQPPSLERQSSGDDSGIGGGGSGLHDKVAKLASIYPPDMASIDRILSERNQIVFQEEWYQAIRGLHQLSMLETPGEMTQRLKLVVDLITRALEKYINRPPSLVLDPQSTMAHAQQAREQDLLTCSVCKQVHLANSDNETIAIPEPLPASTVRQWNDTYGHVNAAVWCPGGSDEAAANDAAAPKHITGDDLLPGLVFALIQANPPNIECLLWLCAEFRHPSLHVGEEAYCLATVSSALEFVRRARYQSVDVIPHILYDHFMLRYTYTLKLMLACKDGDLVQVQRLVEGGADVNGLSPDQVDSPLTACVRYNQPRILYYLLFEQHTTVVHVDAVVHLYRGPHERSTALHIATKQGEVEMVLMLLAAGANRYLADEEGCTPLSIAMEAEQEHLQELVTSESPPSIQYLAMYSSPYALLHTILLADCPRIDVVDMILRKDPVAERLLAGLIVQGVDVHHVHSPRRCHDLCDPPLQQLHAYVTPLMAAVLVEDLQLVKMLLSIPFTSKVEADHAAGPAKDSSATPTTASSVAMTRSAAAGDGDGDGDGASYFGQYHNPVDEVNVVGETALLVCVEKCLIAPSEALVAIATILLRAGASRQCRDSFGRSPVSVLAAVALEPSSTSSSTTTAEDHRNPFGQGDGEGDDHVSGVPPPSLASSSSATASHLFSSGALAFYVEQYPEICCPSPTSPAHASSAPEAAASSADNAASSTSAAPLPPLPMKISYAFSGSGYTAAGDEDSFSITTHLFGGVATSAAALDTTTDVGSHAIEALLREVIMPRESLGLVLQSLLLQDPAAGSTAPIYQCTRHHDYASVRALLLQATDVNVVCPTKGYSPLIAAVYNRDVKMIQLLLHSAALARATSPLSATWAPVFFALSKAMAIDASSASTATAFTATTATVTATTSSDAHRLLPASPTALFPVSFTVANALQVDQAGRGGMTALHYAAQLGLTTVVGLLLARGAQRGIANLQQHTAVDVAVANGHMDTANVLRFDPHKISLCLAAKHGDWLVMKALLLQGISINVVKEHIHPHKGRHYELDTPLIAAVSHGQYELVKRLLTELPTYAGHGEDAVDADMVIFPQVLDVNQVNTIGQSALMYAAARGEENIILLLLKHGADRYAKDLAGHDAVHWAMAQNHTHLATILRHDPDLIYVHDLIRKNDFDAVVAMFKQGVDVNLRRERLLVNLSHPTVVAAREEAAQSTPPVLQPASASNGANGVSATGTTTTGAAAAVSSSLSLSSTASSIASTATSSLFMYHHGRRLSAPTVARLEALQEFARMFIPGETPLIVAARYARMDVLQLLFKAPTVDIDAIDDTNGWSALFYAAEQGHEEVVKFLLAKKANRKIEDCLGRCARDIALLHHHEVIAAMIDADPYHVHIHDTCQHGLLMLTIGLLKQGCPPTFRDERPGMHRQTPLMAAASGGQVDIMRMLLRYPAVYDGKDDRDALGRTALMRAAAVGALDATAVLLNAGCDRSLQDQQGLTARDHAARHSFSVMFQFMSQSMVR